MNSFLSPKQAALYENGLVICLRLSLAIIFIWFGLMKMAGYNSVYELVSFSMIPAFAEGAGLAALGALEVIIGLLLLSNVFLSVACVVLVLHLLGTFSVFVYGWQVVFKPFFPVLSLEGEFVVKNLTLAVAGLLILIHEVRKRTRCRWCRS